LDQAIEREHEQFGDFLRLDHVEGYLELSAKTKTYFATALATWDAEYYLKVDDDIHVNLGMCKATIVDTEETVCVSFPLGFEIEQLKASNSLHTACYGKV
jgi:hypothetical protein